MPLEIRELVVRTNIVTNHSEDQNLLSDENLQQMKKEIVQECVQRVKDQIKKQPKR